MWGNSEERGTSLSFKKPESLLPKDKMKQTKKQTRSSLGQMKTMSGETGKVEIWILVKPGIIKSETWDHQKGKGMRSSRFRENDIEI